MTPLDGPGAVTAAHGAESTIADGDTRSHTASGRSPQRAAPNRAERRRSRALERQQRGLRRFHRDAGGAFQVRIVRADAAPWFLALDPIFQGAVVQWMEAADAVHPQCADCDTELTTAAPPMDWVLLVPAMRDDPPSVLMVGVCADCSARLADDHDLMAALLPRLRSTWPALRRIDQGAIAADAGRA
jgi:hypothetical protein